MFDIEKLITALSGSKNVTINVFNNADAVTGNDDVVVTPESDFTEGDAVWVCHIAKDGTTRHTKGIVDSIGEDERGPYVRVTGENDKHYKCGLHLNEERLGSKIFDFVA